jgi:hypothetical protein
MITVREVDGLVVADDAVAARLWPRLGARVRKAYLADRDGWVGLRRRVEAGEVLPASTLVAQRKVFSGWARAFHAAATARPKRALTPRQPSRSAASSAAASAVGPAAAKTATAASIVPRASALAAPALATVSKDPGGAGTAVAGGLVLAGLIAVAARRRSP